MRASPKLVSRIILSYLFTMVWDLGEAIQPFIWIPIRFRSLLESWSCSALNHCPMTFFKADFGIRYEKSQGRSGYGTLCLVDTEIQNRL